MRTRCRPRSGPDGEFLFKIGGDGCVLPGKLLKMRGMLLKMRGMLLKMRGMLLKMRGVLLKMRGVLLKMRGMLLKMCGMLLKMRGMLLKMRGVLLKMRGMLLKMRGMLLKMRGMFPLFSGGGWLVAGNIRMIKQLIALKTSCLCLLSAKKLTSPSGEHARSKGHNQVGDHHKTTAKWQQEKWA